MSKNKIFSGKPPSRAEAASSRLDVARAYARGAGISFPKAKPRTVAEKEAEAKRLEKLYQHYQEERKKEWDEKLAEFERRQPIRYALSTNDSASIISALYRVVPSSEQDQLDEYDSNELVKIAEIYGNGYMPLEESIQMYEEQRAEAEAEIKSGSYDVNWKEEDPF